MKSQPPQHPCRCCKGTGKETLEGPLLAAYHALPPTGKRNVFDAACKLSITEQAMNARLVTLLNLGLVTRTKKGKKFFYSRQRKT